VVALREQFPQQAPELEASQLALLLVRPQRALPLPVEAGQEVVPELGRLRPCPFLPFLEASP